MTRNQGRSLAERAQGAREGTPQRDDRAVQQDNMLTTIERMRPEFEAAMPTGREAVRLIRDAQHAVKTVPNLAKCTPMSVFGGLMTLAQLNLRCGVGGQGWLVPFWDSRSSSYVATVIVGYKGYIELGFRSDRLDDIVARTVYDGDEFDVEFGLEPKLVHKPNMDADPATQTPIAYYAVARFRPSGSVFWVMSEKQMQAYMEDHAPRNRQGKVTGPWADPGPEGYEAMARKTCIRQLVKYLPQNPDMQTADAVDGTVRVDTNPDANVADVSHRYDNGNVVPGDVVSDATEEQTAEEQADPEHAWDGVEVKRPPDTEA